MRISVAPPAPSKRLRKSTQDLCEWSEGPNGTIELETVAGDVVVMLVLVVASVAVVVVSGG